MLFISLFLRSPKSSSSNSYTMPSSSSSSSSSSSPSTYSKLIFFFFISTTLTVINLPTAISKTAFFSCSESQFYEQSAYRDNLVKLLLSLTSRTADTGFLNTTIGRSPDTVYGYALCRGDLTPAQCQPCLDLAAEDALRQCSGRRQAAVWYDYCRLRYSDEPFFSSLTVDVREPYYYSFAIVPDRDLFKLRIGKLMKDLRDKAVDGGKPGLFAAGSINYTAGESLYGMVQCTRDLSGDDCSKCLDAPIGQTVCCMESDDMTFHGGSCYLRYSTRLFYNSTVAIPASTAHHDTTTREKPSTSKGNDKSATILILAFCGAGILLILLGLILKTRIKRKPKHITLGRNMQLQEGGGLKFHRLTSKKISLFHNQKSPESPMNDAQKLDLQTMKIATENFSDSRRLGRGEFGPSFKGEIHGREFVIKRLTGLPKAGPEELKKEFRSLKQIQHPNIVRLMACDIEGEDRLLVYEYLPNTSLDRILFDPKKRILLDWGRRYKIIEGVGRGLLQLHEESGLNIIHQNLKASNILLDKNMNPKLSDFCLPKLFIGNQSQGNNRRTAASQGYTENVMNGPITTKADVFSYGVLVLEIVTGQRNRDFLGSESTTNLLNYVWQYWREEKALQVLDWSLGEMYKGHEVLRCIHIGLLCVQEDVSRRPNISTVVHMLNSYSFTLPSPSMPSVTRARRATNSDNPPRNGGSGSWDWKLFNQNLSHLSPQSPHGWSDISLDSRGQTRR